MALLGLLTIQSIRAQAPKTHLLLLDTIPYIMDHHNNRLAQFTSEPMAKGGFIFMGNSITEGGPWQKLIGKHVVNRGIGGDISFGILNRLDEVIERQPEKFFLMIGTNDMSKDIPENIVAHNVKKVILRMQKESPKTQIFLQSILPLNPKVDGFLQGFGKQNQVLMCNQLLSKVAEETKVTFINLFPYFLNEDLLLKEEFTYDGVHLTLKGYEFWASHLKSKGYLER